MHLIKSPTTNKKKKCTTLDVQKKTKKTRKVKQKPVNTNEETKKNI